MTTETYPDRYHDLSGRMRQLADAAPAVMKGFGAMHRTASTDGALTATTKELMALAIAIVVRCDGCIAFHVHDAVRSGATEAEVNETIGVAVFMGGGPAAIYATEARRAYEEFTAAASE